MKYVYPKILITFLFILAVNVVISTVLLIHFTRKDFEQNLREHLDSSAEAVTELVRAKGLDPERAPELDATVKRLGTAMDLRITVIDPQGRVLADSQHDPIDMENHAARPEVQEALENRVGRETRMSPTLGIPMTYLAVPLRNGDAVDAVVRVALPQERIGRQIVNIVYVSSIVATAVGALIAAIISLFAARMYSRPIQIIRDAALKISGGNFKYRINLRRRDELSHVAEALNDMSSKLGQTFKMLKREKERNIAIISGLNEQVLVLAADDTIYLANEALCRLLRLRQEDIFERDYKEVISAPEVLSFIADASQSPKSETREITLPSGDQGPRTFRLSSSPILSRKGRFRGLVIIFHDVTLIKEIERMRREFLDNASHELKTPISAILAAAETLLEREPADPDRRDKFYRTIQDNTARLHNLINDMLDLSEIEQKKATLDFEPVNINPIVRDVIAEFWPAIGKKNHTLEVKAPGEDVIVEVDRRSLAKVLGNLVDNAIRYTEPGGRIAVRVVPLADSGDVRIDVEDSGIGIPAHELDRVFERFYRVDKARSMRSGGTGLGLAIVKHIMEAMGGRVAVQSQPGKGSVFSLFLPTVHRPVTQAPSPNLSGSSPPPARVLDVS